MDSGVNKALHLLQQENSKLKETVAGLQDENKALQSYIRGMSALFEAAETIASHDNLFKLLDEILYQALVIINTDHGSLLLVNEETRELVFIMVHGEFRQRLQGFRMNWHQGVAGWVVKNGEALIVNQAHFDPRFSSEVDHTFGFITHKILAVPLKAGTKVLGVIELVNKHDGSDFTESDSTILSLLGLIAGISLDNLERYLAEQEKSKTS